MKKRETARERDERIVAEARPWTVVSSILSFDDDWYNKISDDEADAVLEAAARILNRIGWERGKKR